MRQGMLLALAAGLGGGSCGGPSEVIVALTVQNVPAGARALRLVARLDGAALAAKDEEVPVPAGGKLGLKLPSAGELALRVDAVMDDGCAGAASAEIKQRVEAGRSDVTAALLALEPRLCRLTLERTGDGTIGVEGDMEACGARCTREVPKDKVITVVAAAGPGAFLAGLSGGCDDLDGCKVRMTGAKQVLATFVARDRRRCPVPAGNGTTSICYDNPLPQGGRLEALSGVPGTSHLWAVGEEGVIVHGDGRAFLVEESGTQEDLLAVWATAADDVWAVGEGPTLLHRDAKGWVDRSSQITGVNYLQGVWARGTDDVWVGTEEGMRRWDGISWQLVGDSKWDISGIYGDGDGGLWAVGIRNDSGDALVVRCDKMLQCSSTTLFDGKALADTELLRVWAADKDHAWAVGTKDTVLSWDGAAWKVVRHGDWQPNHTVWGTGPSDVWVGSVQSEVIHFDGKAWSPRMTLRPGMMDYSMEIGGFWSAKPGEMWAACSGGQVLHGDVSDAARRQWSRVTPAGPTGALNAVAGGAAGELWIAGDDGALYRRAGEAYAAVPSKTKADLYAIWAAAPDDLWAVGEESTIVHISNGVATASQLMPRADLQAVWGSAADDLWAAGDDGTIFRYRQGQWAQVASGTTHHLYSLWGSGAGDVWVVGNQKTVLRWDGMAWKAETLPMFQDPNLNLYGVWGTGASDVWIGGDSGAAHWDGAKFTIFDGYGDWRMMGAGKPGEVWSIGGHVARLRLDGQGTITREILADDAGNDLLGVLYDGTRLWVVGERGVVLEVRP